MVQCRLEANAAQQSRSADWNRCGPLGRPALPEPDRQFTWRQERRGLYCLAHRNV